ncbi:MULTISPECIES: PfkB family carbohydrate kinase [Phytobacter]|uniref:pyridoxal kinase n=1 Tax=Phytobacter diazotrophicus TaxID=395631 RepID=A0ABM7VW89_9ENTR|nr:MULTISPECIES: PfkB family carbohydrate kinase [Phytobacter]MDU4150001.1 PfkB family carbohydrate kinase [Enterobacteriaceae bacterium]MDU7380776.1 PfkB family carbohydrate kinase [Enterobacteriaceae bacterium]BDD51462.1 pyridoxine/pyridoxal/pyridoxamine kinase [Phytobacter diazotrophicus]BEG82491.1 pyridoxine/pyridoxal/pyridoxamine kinase [Phytobacter diazotrophicus]BEG88293.1 pyridoxine/pyridoxal/pyridoxamine kinase [Phytobacter diazotrophicus]
MSSTTRVPLLVDKPDVISVQSQVTYGSVGNSIALPALTQHGIHALAVPTFLLSNTPHFPASYGGEIPDAWFHGYLRAIEERGQAGSLQAVLTGYLGSVAKARALHGWLIRLREINPSIRVIIDPVMGDEDTGFYVAPELATFYREHLVPLATGLTPNVFELSQLCGCPLQHREDIVQGARTLLTKNTRWVVVTSAATVITQKTMEVFCVTPDSVTVTEHCFYKGAPKGTGDLFSAELTARILQGYRIEDATQLAALFTAQRVLESQAAGYNELYVQPGKRQQ